MEFILPNSKKIEEALEAFNEQCFNAAASEGWTLTTCFGSENGDLQVQRIDDPSAWAIEGHSEPPLLDSDEVAWRIVGHGNGEHHKVARDILAIHNPCHLDDVIGFKPINVELDDVGYSKAENLAIESLRST